MGAGEGLQQSHLPAVHPEQALLLHFLQLPHHGAAVGADVVRQGAVFGEALAFTPTLGDCVEVVSDRNSEVLFMEYEHIMKRCSDILWS